MKQMFVSYSVCPLCFKQFESGVMESDEIPGPEYASSDGKGVLTGYELCDEHKKICEDGYIFLVEVERNENLKNEQYVSIDTPKRTGNVTCLKKWIADQIFKSDTEEITYCPKDVIDWIKQVAGMMIKKT